MNLLEKFDNLEIKNEDRISEEDKMFCEEQEDIFKKLIVIYDEFILKLKEIEPIIENHRNKYSKKEDYCYVTTAYGGSIAGSDSLEESKNKMKNQFVESICNYFERKYNVTLKEESIYKKYNTSITYNNIIDEIFIQLNGFNFKEKAVLEMKNKFKKVLEYKDVAVKKNKLIITNFFWVDQWDKKYGTYKMSYNSREDFYSLLRCISHFEQGTIKNTYEGILYKIDRLQNDDLFCEHVMMCIKLESIKLFKNGKIEIKFLSNEYAQEFAREYCDYIEKVA